MGSLKHHRGRRYRHGFVELVGVVDGVELVEPAAVQHAHPLAILPNDVRIVRDEDEGAVLALLKKFDVTSVAEAGVTDGKALVDEEIGRASCRERVLMPV